MQKQFRGKNIFIFCLHVVNVAFQFSLIHLIHFRVKRNVTEHKKESLDKDTVKADVNLLDIVKRKENCDLYVINTDDDLTDTIKKSFERHGCSVSVSKVQQDLIALYVLLNQKFSIKKLRVLIEKGKKFGIDFCLTKTGMTSILLSRIKQVFQL